jgi:hypothetical protein
MIRRYTTWRDDNHAGDEKPRRVVTQANVV